MPRLLPHWRANAFTIENQQRRVSSIDREAARLSHEKQAAMTESAQSKSISRARRQRRLPVLSLAALLLAASALGIAGYLAYQLKGPVRTQISSATAAAAALDEKIVTLAQDSQSIGQELIALDQLNTERTAQQQAALDDFGRHLEALDASLERRLADTAASVSAQMGEFSPASEAWKIDEIAYLLRISRQRLEVSGDAAAALRMWQAAEHQLERISDSRLLDVRNQVRIEREALEQLEQVDLSRIAKLIFELTDRVDELPLRTSKIIGSDAAEADALPPADESHLQRAVREISADLKSLVSIRKVDPAASLPFSPSTRPHLADSIKSALFGAQIAALQRADAVYQGNLAYVADTLADHFDSNSPQVEKFSALIGNLSNMSVTLHIPDIDVSAAMLSAIVKSSAAVR